MFQLFLEIWLGIPKLLKTIWITIQMFIDHAFDVFANHFLLQNSYYSWGLERRYLLGYLFVKKSEKHWQRKDIRGFISRYVRISDYFPR